VLVVVSQTLMFVTPFASTASVLAPLPTAVVQVVAVQGAGVLTVTAPVTGVVGTFVGWTIRMFGEAVAYGVGVAPGVGVETTFTLNGGFEALGPTGTGDDPGFVTATFCVPLGVVVMLVPTAELQVIVYVGEPVE
jgi:hypothetical protein